MKKIYTRVIAFIVLALPFYAKAQVTTAANAGGPTDYVGWNSAQAFPLQIRHNGNQPINFFTDSTLRMKLNESVSYDINGASGTNLSREGYLLLGKNNNFSSTANPIYKEGAFSLLHLNGYNGNTIDELGYRNWMQTGKTFTGNYLTS